MSVMYLAMGEDSQSIDLSIVLVDIFKPNGLTVGYSRRKDA